MTELGERIPSIYPTWVWRKIRHLQTAEQRLRRAKDLLGWRPPYHSHTRLIRNGVDAPFDPEYGPLYHVECLAADCTAESCPRTASGFPE